MRSIIYMFYVVCLLVFILFIERYLCMKHNILMLPVHHMAAHALTARMETTDLKFPFLVK